MKNIMTIFISKSKFINILQFFNKNSFEKTDNNFQKEEIEKVINSNYEKIVFDKSMLPNFYSYISLFDEEENQSYFYLNFFHVDVNEFEEEKIKENLENMVKFFHKNMKKRKECLCEINSVVVREYYHENFLDYLANFFDFSMEEMMFEDNKRMVVN